MAIDPELLAPWWAELRRMVVGRKVVVTVELAAGATTTVDALARLGAADVLVVATGGMGTGRRPAVPDHRLVVLGVSGSTGLGAARAGQAALATPDPTLRAALQAFDPEREALAVGSSINGLASLDGRPYLARRRAAWLELDDKTTVDRLWDRAGVPRTESEVVALDSTSLGMACRRLDQGAGTVWAADSTDGWHGGAERVRHVSSSQEAAAALEFFRPIARTVRIMPFLDGIPCSIHGIVFDDHVVALRPVELIVLRRDDGSFFYAGCSTFYDPPEDDRHQLRDIARAVGRRLATEVGFRGAFTVDGVLTRRGFRPTELNPRPGAGLRILEQGFDLPVPLLLDAVTFRSSLEWRATELEVIWLAHADAVRAAATYHAGPAGLDLLDEVGLVADGSSGPRGSRPDRPVGAGSSSASSGTGDLVLRPVGVGEPPLLRYTIGQGHVGPFVRAVVAADGWPVGRSVAGLAASFWDYAERTHRLGIGRLRPAVDARV